MQVTVGLLVLDGGDTNGYVLEVTAGVVKGRTTVVLEQYTTYNIYTKY